MAEDTKDTAEEVEQVPHRVMGMVQVWVRVDAIIDAFPGDTDDVLQEALADIASECGVDDGAVEWETEGEVVVIPVAVHAKGRHSDTFTPLAPCNACQHDPRATVAGCSCNCHGLDDWEAAK